jgi:hypothetical protein
MSLLDRGTLALGSLLFVAVFTAVAGTAEFPAFVGVLQGGAILAVVLSVPLSILGVVYAGRYDTDRVLRGGLAGIVAVAAVGAAVFATFESPGHAPLFGVVVFSVGLFWGLFPLAFGATVGPRWRVSFQRVLIGWPLALVVGAVLFVLSGGPVWRGVLYLDGLGKAVLSVLTLVVVGFAPVGTGGVIAAVRG